MTPKMLEPDYDAARVHRRNAELHYEASERARALDLNHLAAAALELAKREDAIADALSNPTTATEGDSTHDNA